MYGFVRDQLRRKMSRAVALALGILVASVSFVLLTSASRTSALRVTGQVSKSFRAPYDILVRPRGSLTELEKARGLVQENYLSGIFGGISLSDYRQIKQIPGVQVAAPIANVGYIMPFQFIPVRINRFLSDEPTQLYRLKPTWFANNGVSHYPAAQRYVYFTKIHRFVQPDDPTKFPVEVLPNGNGVEVCAGYGKSQEQHYLGSGPFAYRGNSGLQCFSARGPLRQMGFFDLGPFKPGIVGSTFTAYFPIFIAGIDPIQEQKLIGLDRTITSGRPLAQRDGIQSLAGQGLKVVPVLASTKTYVDENLRVQIERLSTPADLSLPQRLASSRGTDRFLNHLGGDVVGRLTFSTRQIYERLLEHYSKGLKELRNRNNVTYDGYYSVSATRYKKTSGNVLEALPVHNPVESYQSYYYGTGWAPVENRDTGYRHLAAHHANSAEGQNATFHVVGRFDPSRLPGFDPLSRVPLETYNPPSVQPADRKTSNALGGRPLLPTQNLAGYIAQPPLMLTTLKGIRVFHDPAYFDPPGDRNAPISVIRVRVANVSGPDSVSRERIRVTAQRIHDITGLDVDITAGSSPHPLLVQLAAGKFGQPPFLVREGWVKKGVAVKFLSAVDRKSLVLFVLVLVACGLFLVNAALASVRSRRTEMGTLLCCGWSRRDIFRVVLMELALVGVVTGVLGVLLALLLASVLSLDIPLLQVALVLPIALLLTLLAGWLPARRAASATPMDTVAPVTLERGRRRPVGSYRAMAVANLARVPARTLLGASGLFIGVAALTVLIALNLGFRHSLAGTLLGNAISVEIRGVDYLSAVLVIALGALSVVDVLYINLKQREGELAALRTVGWANRDLGILITLESLGIGILGSGLGALSGVAGATLVRGIPLAPIMTAGLVACLCGLLATIVASLVPAARIASLVPRSALAEE